jgi:hypothetical protein
MKKEEIQAAIDWFKLVTDPTIDFSGKEHIKTILSALEAQLDDGYEATIQDLETIRKFSGFKIIQKPLSNGGDDE